MLRWAVIAFAIGASMHAAPSMAQEKAAIAEAGAIAEEAYLYGFPMIVGYDVLYKFFIDRDSGQLKAPINQLHNEARVFTPKDTGISTPNSDTPYSMALLDLRAEPMVLCMPEIEKTRYYDVQLVDLYTDNYGYMGSRTTGNGAGCYLVVGPDWKGEKPKGIAKVFRSETQFSLVIYRTQLFKPADMENVKKVQAGYKVQPLSAFLGTPAPPVPAEQWEMIVHAKDNDPTLDPATAPARRDPRWEKYWNIKYSILGSFKTPEERAKIPYATAMDGGGDPETQYMLIQLSRKFGPVYVMRGKMPTFPNTYAGAGGTGLEVMPEAQTQYWSLVSCEAMPSSHIVDALTDMQVPLDKDGNYTIVYSRKEDRPANATEENGVAWIEWSPRGEGIDGPKNRPDFGMLILRFMANNPSWKERPDNITKPGMEEAVMGPYYPRGYYTTRAEFETSGPKK